MSRPVRLHCGIEGCLCLGFVLSKDSDEDCQCGHKECFHHVGQAKATWAVGAGLSDSDEQQFRFATAITQPFASAGNAYRNAFISYVKSIAKEFPQALEKWPYFAPYISICQGSGSGKTKLILSCDAEFLIIYICTREPGMSGVPGRTDIPADLLTLTCDVDADYRRFFIALFSTLQSMQAEMQGEPTPQSWNSYVLKHSTFWAKVKHKFEELSEAHRKSVGADHVAIGKQLREQYLSWRQRLPEQLRSREVLVAFDEARSLLKPTKSNSQSSLFRQLRRALKCFDDAKFVAVFMDTTCRLHNFLPVKSADPSMKDIATGSKLPDPFYHIGTLGVVPLDPVFAGAQFWRSYGEVQAIVLGATASSVSVVYNPLQLAFYTLTPFYLLAIVMQLFLSRALAREEKAARAVS